MNEDWETRCVRLINSEDYKSAAEAKELLDKLKHDKEMLFVLIDRDNIQLLQLWYVKALCNKPHKESLMVIEFIQNLERDINLVQDNKDDIYLVDDIKIIELAYRIINKKLPKKRKPNHGEIKMVNLEAQRLLTMEDAVRIIERGENLPFYVDKKL
jgi:hypothetical protein